MEEYRVAVLIRGIKADNLGDAERQAKRLVDNLGKEYDILDVCRSTDYCMGEEE